MSRATNTLLSLCMFPLTYIENELVLKNVLETTKLKKQKKNLLYFGEESLFKITILLFCFFKIKLFPLYFQKSGVSPAATSVAFFDGRWKCLNHWTAQIASSYQEITSCYLVLIRLFWCFQDRRGATLFSFLLVFHLSAARCQLCAILRLYCATDLIMQRHES